MSQSKENLNELEKNNIETLSVNKKQYSKLKNRFFVPTTLLFFLPVIFLINIIASTFRFPDLASHILLIVGGFTVLRIYLVGFLSLDYTYFFHKWISFIGNMLFVAVSLWSVYTAISDLSLNSYPTEWFVQLTFANLLFILQMKINGIGKSAYYQTHLCQIIFLLISVGSLWQRFFDGQRAFITVLSVLAAVFEVFIFILSIRLLFKWEALLKQTEGSEIIK